MTMSDSNGTSGEGTQGLTAQQLLEREERQLFLFQNEVRQVGEEKSELYPEPQYFYISYLTVILLLPEVVRMIERKGGAKFLAGRMRRILSPATALHASGMTFLLLWAREMWLMEGNREPGSDFAGECGDLRFTDGDAAELLCFFHDWVRAYRADGLDYPAETSAYGEGYKLLRADEVAGVLDATEPVDAAAAGSVLGLLASTRALSFLMEAETREALMMHGPYETGIAGESLVFLECSDLHWADFPSFPLPDGARWELPSDPFPVANLAVALVVKQADIVGDRFGTLYIEPLHDENVARAALFTRDPAGEVRTLPLAEADAYRRRLDAIQEEMFLQVAGWTFDQRMAAGHYQTLMLLARILRSADVGEPEVQAFLDRAFDVAVRMWQTAGVDIARRQADDMPFYGKSAAFASGEIAHIFTPLTVM